MKVLLAIAAPDTEQAIGPYYRLEPLGLEYLSSYLTSRGHETSIVDVAIEGTGRDALVREAADGGYGAIGLSVNYLNQPGSVVLARALRRATGLPVIAGGHFASMNPELCMDEGVDYVVIGEGEQTLFELVEHLQKGSGAEPSGIAGLAYSLDGRLTLSAPRARIKDLDAVPMPDRRFWRLDKYMLCPGMPIPKRNAKPILVCTSRGCAYDCSFCTCPSFWKNRWVGRSPENVMEELTWAVREHGIRHVYFVDEDMNTDRARAARLYDLMVRERLPLKWGCDTAMANLDEELVDKMADSGCCGIGIGFETGSREHLKKFKKRYDHDAARRIIARAGARGIFTVGNFIIGLPWDSRESIRESITFIHSLRLNMYPLTFFRPRRGSKLYDEAVRSGRLAPAGGMDGPYDYYSPPLPTEHLSVNEVRREMINFVLRTYGRPSYWLFSLGYVLRNPVALESYVELVRLVARHGWRAFTRRPAPEPKG